MLMVRDSQMLLDNAGMGWSISHDGQLMAFAKEEADGSSDIYLMTVEGKELRQLTGLLD